MADPLRALRAPLAPVDPDPVFATRLRARLERAMNLPKGVVMTDSAPIKVATEPRPAAIPYLAVADARRAINWYVDVFGARVQDEPIVMPDGRIGHCTLEVGGGVLYLADAYPELGAVAPSGSGSPVSLMLNVADADETRARAQAAGASADREPYDGHGHRNAWITDPFGHRWGLQSPVEQAARPPARRPRHGDITYVSLWAPDVERSAAFYAKVLGWEYTPDQRPNGRHVVGGTPHIGMWGGQERNTLFCCYAVDDIDAAVERIRAAGGQAEAPTQEPFGRVASCVDNQGVEFAIAGASEGADEAAAAGDLAYLTLEFVDVDMARDFYGAVLGWRFRPGQVEHGWAVDDVSPMTGLWGGRAANIGVPMWRVDDIDAAVRRVRDAGGTATAPERQSYGVTAECTDDQGTRFYLGQV